MFREWLRRNGDKQESNKDTSCLTFICQLGQERSVAAARAMNDAGIKASHLPGGTKVLSTLNTREIKALLKKCPQVVLIYDQGSSDKEYDRYNVSAEKLREAGIPYVTYDGAMLRTLLWDNGKNPDDYFL